MTGDVPKTNPKSPTAPPPPPPPGGRETLFLSGDGDSDLLERRNDRLRQVLGLESTVGRGGASGSGDGGRRRNQPVIEVVAVEEEGAQTSASVPVEGGGANDGCEADGGGGGLRGDGVGGNTPGSTRDDGRSHDDPPPDLISPAGDDPPPLSWIAADESVDQVNGGGSTAAGQAVEGGGGAAAVGFSTGAAAAGDGPSLMDEMLQDATRARTDEVAKSKARERKAAKDASFGKGLKKGFLSSSRKKKAKGNARRSASVAKTSGTERTHAEQQLSSKQPSKVNSSLGKSMRNASLCEQSRDETQEEDVYELDRDGNIVKPKRHEEPIPTLRPRNKASSGADADRLVFEEVQEAMRNNPLDKLNDARDVWATPDLMEKIAGNPRLAAGMANPKYTAALEALQRNPKDAMAEFRHHPDIVDFLNEFCSVMGEHFTQIGVKQDKSDGTPGNIGPLAQEAIRRQEKMRSERGKEIPLSREEKERVDAIVADEELSRLLMDPDMQRILQECGRPGRMGYFMQHPDHGPKLRKLIDAGLFKVEQ